jgi:hypothetical protein
LEVIDFVRKVSPRLVATVALALVLGGCAASDAHTCPAGLKALVSAELYFGRTIPGGGVVSEADWQRFIDEEVTPRFPDGLTVQDASGQWKSLSDGALVHEASKRLFVLISGSPLEAAKLEAIRIAYRTRFRQEAVLLIEAPICGAF